MTDFLASLHPSWQRDALCHEHPEVTWFPVRGQPARPAIAICQRCAVQTECRKYALDLHIDVGIWGGTTERTRRALRAAARTTQAGS